MKKSILILALCALPTLLLGGCARNAGNLVSDAASKVGSAVSGALEEGVNSPDHVQENIESAASKIEEDKSSHDESETAGDTSTVDSGTDGLIGEEESPSSAPSALEEEEKEDSSRAGE